jgi:hypothetical protein
MSTKLRAWFCIAGKKTWTITTTRNTSTLLHNKNAEIFLELPSYPMQQALGYQTWSKFLLQNA